MDIYGFLKSFQFWALSTPSNRPYIFVVGAPRSGTSLLKNLLITHSKLCGTDRESTGLMSLRNIWRFEIGELDRTDVMLLLSTSKNLPSFYDKLAQELLRRKDAEKFVDKINIKQWRIKYLLKYFPNAKYINIARDGRDSYCSAIRHPNIPQSKSVESYAKYWKKCIDLPLTLIPSKCRFTLRYEDLVCRPEVTMLNVMEFLDLSFEVNQTNVDKYSKVSTLRKKEVHKNLKAPITAKSVGRWHNEMSSADKDTFWRLAGSSLQRLDYLP